MKKDIKNMVVKVTITAIFGVTPLMLQAEELPERGPIPFEVYDQNKDGFISETEFYDIRAKRMEQRAKSGRPMRKAANSPTFSDFDTDSDGKLTPKELQDGQNVRMQQRGGKGMGKGPR